MSISRSVKAVSWQFATLSLGLLAFAGVSAAPGVQRAGATPRGNGRQQLSPGASVPELQAQIAAVKAWGQEHNVAVKTDDLEDALFRLQRLAFPNDRVDGAAYQRGLAQRERVPAARFGPSGAVGVAALSKRWEYLGPNNLAVPEQSHFGQGVMSGRVNGVAFDPNVTGTYWVAAASGGAWKTLNSGQTWSFRSQSWPSLATSCVAISPADGNTVYVGTGDFQGSIAPGVGGSSFGIMKTIDGGLTWTNLGKAQFGTTPVSDILIDPENPQIVIAATGRGASGQGQVWRSTNGGQTWTAVITTLADWSGLTVGAASAAGARYYWAIGQGVASGELWRSADRGATWTEQASTLGAGVQSGLDIAASRITPDTVYMMSGTDRLIRKSIDAGVNWTDTTNNFPHHNQGTDNYNWSQQSYDWHLTTSVNGTNDAVYVGLIDLVMSPDSGATWKSVGATYGPASLTHDDQHCVAVNPKNANEILVGNDGGVCRMTYTPGTGAVAFNSTLNAGLGITQFNKADYHPIDLNQMLGGARDNAIPVALGDLTRWRSVGRGDGGGVAVNPITPTTQYAAYSQFTPTQTFSIIRTLDTWNTAPVDITPDWGTDHLPVIGRLAIDPSNPNLLYAGTNYLWRRNEETANWIRLGSVAPLASGATGVIVAIAVAPSDSKVIYTGASTGEIYMSSNAGVTWTLLNQSPTNLPLRSVESIAVNPTNSKQILVGLNGTGAAHVWRCAQTDQVTPVWSNVSGSGTAVVPDSPVNAVVYDPTSPTTRYYVASDLGVYRTMDAGTTWENATTPLGLPNVRVMDLKVASAGYLMAATYGSGIWRIDPQATVTKLIVTKPNGGETLRINQPTTITWTSQGFGVDHQVKIELSRDGGITFPEVLAASAPDTGSFIWTPQSPASTSVRIKITSLLDPTVSDVSDANITTVLGSFDVLAPNGGEVVRLGERVMITWRATDFALTSPTVIIELSRDGGQSYGEVLFEEVSTAAGQAEWTVTGPASTQARVRVTPTNIPSFSDASDSNFEIRVPSALKLQRPNGGEQLSAGSSVSLLWNGAGFAGNVRIELSRNGGSTWEVLFPDTPNDGAEVWEVVGPATRFGRIRVVSISEPNVSDQSDGVFSVETPSIQVTAPKAGKTLLKGVPATITWTSTGLAASESVQLEFSRDGGNLWEPIQAAVSNSGQYTFTPSGAVSSSCRVRVSSVEPDGPSAESGTFNLVEPTLFLVAPNGKEKWPIGDQRIIEWSGSAVGTGTVSIELFRNKREGWVTLIEDTPNDGAQAWGVSGALSTKAKIRVIWNSGSAASLEAESRKTFQIVKQKKSKKNSRSGR